MKSFVLLIAYVLGCVAAFGELSTEDLERLQQMVGINSVRNETIRDENREKIEVLKFATTQDERQTEGYCIRVTVELVDKEGTMYCVQLVRRQIIPGDYEYAGEDRWELRIPHGDLSRPDIAAYVIEYGTMDGNTFVPIAVEAKGVENREGLVERCQLLDEEKAGLWHAFVYREDTGSEDDTSSDRDAQSPWEKLQK